MSAEPIIRPALPAAQSRNAGRYHGLGREWGTPPEVFQPLNLEFQFTIDVCASRDNAKLPRYWTEADNGLRKSWAGERCWMNPPYGRELYAWTAKARAESMQGALVVALLPASCDLAWWHDDVVGYAEVRYIRGRVKYISGLHAGGSVTFASVIVIWRSRLHGAERQTQQVLEL